MGTHPIFESDFDCLTENMTSVACTWNQINLDNELNGFLNGVGNFLLYTQFRRDCDVVGCPHCGQYPISLTDVQNWRPPTTTFATTTTVTTTAPTTLSTTSVATSTTFTEITTAGGLQPQTNLVLLFLMLLLKLFK